PAKRPQSNRRIQGLIIGIPAAPLRPLPLHQSAEIAIELDSPPHSLIEPHADRHPRAVSLNPSRLIRLRPQPRLRLTSRPAAHDAPPSPPPQHPTTPDGEQTHPTRPT